MSILTKVEADINQQIEDNKDVYERHALQRVQKRREPPKDPEELALAVRGEMSLIRYNMIKEEALEQWVKMFMVAIKQSSSSYRSDLEQAMLEAYQRSHRFDQSEFMFRLIKLFENIADSDTQAHFDARNLWTQDLARRFTFAAMHPEEMSVLMKMDDKQLRDMRIKAQEDKQ